MINWVQITAAGAYRNSVFFGQNMYSISRKVLYSRLAGSWIIRQLYITIPDMMHTDGIRKETLTPMKFVFPMSCSHVPSQNSFDKFIIFNINTGTMNYNIFQWLWRRFCCALLCCIDTFISFTHIRQDYFTDNVSFLCACANGITMNKT